MLCVTSVVLVLACLLEVRADQRVALGCLPGWPFPETCLSRSAFGVSCPGCGLTRSFVYLAHGDWIASWNMHRLGWFLALAVVLQLPYRAWALCSRDQAPLGKALPKVFGSVLIALLLVNWLMNVILRYLK